MAKGQKAKDNVAKKLAEAFGDDFIGCFDKKYYVWSIEDGQKVQVAISMTCPKTPVEFGVNTGGDWDWSDNPVKEVPVVKAAVAEITPEERQNIADLMARCNL